MVPTDDRHPLVSRQIAYSANTLLWDQAALVAVWDQTKNGDML